LVAPADVSDKSQVFSTVDQVLQQWGRVDILVNNAGIGFQGPFASMPLEDFEKVLRVNLFGCAYYASAVIPVMARQKHGQIINISSLLGKRGFPGSAAYCASKFALCGFSESLRVELASSGISVLSFCPALTDTPIFEHLLPSGEHERPSRKGMDVEDVAREILDAAWKNKREVLLTLRGKAITWLNKIFPSLADFLFILKYQRKIKVQERR
jgi:short-subunit dehydrogenase